MSLVNPFVWKQFTETETIIADPRMAAQCNNHRNGISVTSGVMVEIRIWHLSVKSNNSESYGMPKSKKVNTRSPRYRTGNKESTWPIQNEIAEGRMCSSQ